MNVEILPFAEDHVAGVSALCADLGWPSLADPDVCRRALTAPGVVARVAVVGAASADDEAADAAVVGFGYAMGDGVIQSYLAQLAVAASYRRRGIAKLLVKEIFDGTGTQRMDLVTDPGPDGAGPFYRSFGHHELPGFRIYPQYTPPWGTPPTR